MIECTFKADGKPEAQQQLGRRLLDVAGERVVWREYEPHLDELLERGEWMSGPVRKRRGQRSMCHTNVAKIWASDVDRYQVCTGYALSKDGLWRQHSWLRDCKGLVETTVARTHYFGVALSQVAAAQFWSANLLQMKYSRPLAILANASAQSR